MFTQPLFLPGIDSNINDHATSVCVTVPALLADVLPVALCPDAVEMLCDNILPFILSMEDADSQASGFLEINVTVQVWCR